MSALFNGSSSALYTTAAPFSGNTGTYTYAVFFKSSSIPTGSVGLSIYDYTATRGTHLSFNSADKAQMGVGTLTLNAATSTSAATLNAWQMAAGGWSSQTTATNFKADATGAHRAASMNGEAWAAVQSSYASPTTTLTSIGARMDAASTAAQYFSGAIGYVGIWNTDLSAAAISWLYGRIAAGSCSWADIIANVAAPLVWWDLISDAQAYTDSGGTRVDSNTYDLTDLASSVTYDAEKPFTLTIGASGAAKQASFYQMLRTA